MCKECLDGAARRGRSLFIAWLLSKPLGGTSGSTAVTSSNGASSHFIARQAAIMADGGGFQSPTWAIYSCSRQGQGNGAPQQVDLAGQGDLRSL